MMMRRSRISGGSIRKGQWLERSWHMRCYRNNTEEEEKESGDEVCEIYRLRSCSAL